MTDKKTLRNRKN